MPAHDPDLRHRIAAAGAAARNGMPDAEDKRAALAADRLELAIRKIVEKAPPLKRARLDRLAGLLAAVPAADHDATAAAS